MQDTESLSNRMLPSCKVLSLILRTKKKKIFIVLSNLEFYCLFILKKRYKVNLGGKLIKSSI